MNSQEKLVIISLGLLAAGLSLVPGVEAQEVNKKAREKATWYEAPREFQIIDDRPQVRDFREGPVTPQQVQLPNGPGGGTSYGPSSGALPAGSSSTIPAGGLHIGNPGAGYRTPVDPMGALPKSGFGINSNIPARGILPNKALPMGVTTGVHANLQTAIPKSSPKGLNAGARGAAVTHTIPQPVAASYSGNYRQSPPTNNNSSVNTSVKGTLVGHPLRYRLQSSN